MGHDSFMYVHVVHCSMPKLLLTLYLNVQNTCTNVNHPIVPPGAHKRREVAPRSVQLRMIAWNSDVLTIAARLCPYLDCSYVTATAEATKVYNYYCSDCPIWSTTERSKFQFRTSLFSVVGRSLAPLHGAYGLLVPRIQGLPRSFSIKPVHLKFGLSLSLCTFLCTGVINM